MFFEDITPNNICVCIPARYASSRLHGKLLFDIGGQSVLERTCRKALECKWISKVFILTDHEHVVDFLSGVKFGERVQVILKSLVTRNGTERIGKNLEHISDNFKIIVNIQGDEPFVDPRNVDYVIERHITAHKEQSGESKEIFFSTLHQRIEDLNYLQETSCVKILVNRRNNAMLFTRNVVPWNKDGVVRPGTEYFSCTGLYVYNRERIEEYNALEDTEHQIEEDVEQMKVLEHGYIIKTFECPYFNEISLNTTADYHMLRVKYGLVDPHERSGHDSPISSHSGNVSDSMMESMESDGL